MSGEAKKPIDKEILWSGGRSPFSVSYGKLMMWYFLVSDALTFSGLLVAYGVSRHQVSDPWPIGEQTFEALPMLDGSYPLVYVALMTFILIISSVTMVLAVEAGHRNYKKGVVKWLGWTIVGGFFFVGSQAWEWYHFIHGSGGSFAIEQEMTVNALDERTGEMQSITVEEGTFVFMDGHFGHGYEHALEMREDALLGIMHDHDHDEGHDAHGDDGDAHGEHGDEAHGGEMAHVITLDSEPEVLYLNKYTENKKIIEGAEAHKLWSAMGANTPIFGANLSRNEYGPQQYADCFFFITGFHAFHVFSGVVFNFIIWIMVIKGVFERRKHYEMVEKIGLYWHFVDLVWVFVFTFFYLV